MSAEQAESAHKSLSEKLIFALTDSENACFLSVTAVVTSTLVSVFTRTASVFGSAGTVILLFGVLLTMREPLRKSPSQRHKEKYVIDCGFITEGVGEGPEAEQVRADFDATRQGFWYLVIGTAWSGYASYVMEWMLG